MRQDTRYGELVSGPQGHSHLHWHDRRRHHHRRAAIDQEQVEGSRSPDASDHEGQSVLLRRQGAGFLIAAALLEMMPEGIKMSPRLGPVLIMGGYCVAHLLEHTINAHYHLNNAQEPFGNP
jgi:hypothetical protein